MEVDSPTKAYPNSVVRALNWIFRLWNGIRQHDQRDNHGLRVALKPPSQVDVELAIVKNSPCSTYRIFCEFSSIIFETLSERLIGCM
jgi:hypothetical protein